MGCISKCERALQLFASAKTVSDYEAAKRFASRLDPTHQLAMVDSIRAAKARVTGVA
jgi:hypothetical protein